jgi:hypothetical protein
MLVDCILGYDEVAFKETEIFAYFMKIAQGGGIIIKNYALPCLPLTTVGYYQFHDIDDLFETLESLYRTFSPSSNHYFRISQCARKLNLWLQTSDVIDGLQKLQP